MLARICHVYSFAVKSGEDTHVSLSMQEVTEVQWLSSLQPKPSRPLEAGRAAGLGPLQQVDSIESQESD
jgi:hypothetical protein